MPAVSRIGDTSSHGGSIVTASSDLNANGRKVARQGDMLNCGIHGMKPITTVVTTKNHNGGKLLVTVGAVASCGAVITTGSPSVNAD